MSESLAAQWAICGAALGWVLARGVTDIAKGGALIGPISGYGLRTFGPAAALLMISALVAWGWP